MEELTMLDFFAQMINDHKARQQGYAASTRWLCTSQEIKDECLTEAKQLFEDWKNEELQAKSNRDNLMKNIHIH